MKAVLFSSLFLLVAQGSLAANITVNCATKYAKDAVTIVGEVQSAGLPVEVKSLSFSGNPENNFSQYNVKASAFYPKANLNLIVKFNQNNDTFDTVAVSVAGCSGNKLSSQGSGYVGGVSYRSDLVSCTCELK